MDRQTDAKLDTGNVDVDVNVDGGGWPRRRPYRCVFFDSGKIEKKTTYIYRWRVVSTLNAASTSTPTSTYVGANRTKPSGIQNATIMLGFPWGQLRVTGAGAFGCPRLPRTQTASTGFSSLWCLSIETAQGVLKVLPRCKNNIHNVQPYNAKHIKARYGTISPRCALWFETPGHRPFFSHFFF